MKLGNHLNKCINYEEGEEEYYEDYSQQYFEPINNINIYSTDLIEVSVLNDLYKMVTIKNRDSGEIYKEERLVKRNCKTKETIYKSNIESIKQLLNTKGEPYKTRLQIRTRLGDELIIEGNYNKYKEEIFNIKKPNKIGFI